MKRKLLTALLTVCMVITVIPFNVYAGQVNPTNFEQDYTFEDLGLTVERVITNDKVTAIVKSLDGATLYTAINENGRLSVNGDLISNESSTNLNNYSINSFLGTLSAKSISWGGWSTNTEWIPTGGKPVAWIIAVIFARCPYLPATMIGEAAAIIAGSYDEIGIKVKMRYGYDSTYQYYQRYTTLYGDDEDVAGPYYDTGKEYL